DLLSRTGLYSAQLTNLGSSVSYDEPLTADEGQVWELSGFYYCGTDPQINITFRYYNAAGTVLETLSEQDLGGTPGQWNTFGPFRIEAPPGSSTMSFTVESITETGTVYLDDIALRDVTDV